MSEIEPLDMDAGWFIETVQEDLPRGRAIQHCKNRDAEIRRQERERIMAAVQARAMSCESCADIDHWNDVENGLRRIFDEELDE